MYNWLVVMKNGQQLNIKHKYKRVEDLINEMLPKFPNSKSFTVAELVNKDEFSNNFVVINGEEISHVLYQSY